MEVSLTDGQSFKCDVAFPTTAESILQAFYDKYNIKCQKIYMLFAGKEILLQNSVIDHDQPFRILPVHLADIKTLNECEFSTHQAFIYCFRMYQQSRWLVADHLLIQLFCLLLHINGDKTLENSDRMLLPERQRALFDYYIRRAGKYDFQPSERPELEFVELLSGSDYYDFTQFPVLDIQQDWTSTLGVSDDGVCLIDAEIGTAYLYLQYDYFTFRMEADLVIIQLNKELCKVQNQNFQFPDLQEKQRPKLIDFIANQTKSFELPVFSKMPEQNERKNEKYDKVRQFKVQQSEKFISSINQQQVRQDQLQKSEFLPARHEITLKFGSSQVCQSVYQYLDYQQQQFINSQLPFRQRSLRIMSDSTLELFKQIYLNNCIKYCTRPLYSVIDRIDQLLDKRQDLSRSAVRAEQLFNDLSIRKEKITHMHVRGIVQAVMTALDFNPTLGSFRVDSCMNQLVTRRLQPDNIKRLKNGVTRFYRGGRGTPYDAFVPVNFSVVQNFKLQRFALITNEFINLAWVHEITPLFEHQAVRNQLLVVEISDNLLMNKGAIILADRCKGLANLRALHLNNCRLKQTGLSCFLYLLDSEDIYLQQLSLENVKCTTRAAFTQLGTYIGRCYKRYQKFERLDLSGCNIGLQQAQGFVQGLRNASAEAMINKMMCKGCFNNDELAADVLAGVSVELLGR